MVVSLCVFCVPLLLCCFVVRAGVRLPRPPDAMQSRSPPDGTLPRARAAVARGRGGPGWLPVLPLC